MKSHFITVRLLAALLAACTIFSLLLLSGCASTPEATTAGQAADATTEASEPVIEADPKGAIHAIYDSLNEYSAHILSTEEAEKVLDFSTVLVSEMYLSVSDPHFGLSDIFIVRTLPSSRDKVREELYRYKDRRVLSFENYDILSSYAIAQNAVVFNQGDYVILLMVADPEAAKIIIDQYIPQ